MTKQEIYRELFNRVVRNQYRRGDRLREDALADEFGVSRTPVREALFLLSQDGLAESAAKRGFRSLGFSVDDLEEAYEIRRVLELLALERAVKTFSIQSLQSIRGRIHSLSGSDDALEHARIDTDLHQLIIDSAQTPRLKSIMDGLYRIMRSFRELEFENREIRDAAVTEHIKLIDALVSRDGTVAASILDEHIKASKSRILGQVIQGAYDEADDIQ
jgi:DNA-binding GntR family transcriptional regulator